MRYWQKKEEVIMDLNKIMQEIDENGLYQFYKKHKKYLIETAIYEDMPSYKELELLYKNKKIQYQITVLVDGQIIIEKAETTKDKKYLESSIQFEACQNYKFYNNLNKIKIDIYKKRIKLLKGKNLIKKIIRRKNEILAKNWSGWKHKANTNRK